MAYNLKNISTKMTKFFDLVIKYAGDVVTYEKDAKNAARKMEEASLKAQFARKNMFNVNQLFIYRQDFRESQIYCQSWHCGEQTLWRNGV